MTIVIFIIILLVCVLVHEWGHYIVAKKSGMLVEEFGFGIPPKLFSWGKGETKYSVNALPIGGFVKIAGENGAEENVPIDRQFESKSWYTKSAVLIAGVVCNLILGIVLFTGAYTLGLPGITDNGTPTIVNVVDKTPAQESGLSVGDTVQSVSVDGKMIIPFGTETIHEAIKNSTGDVVINYTHGNITKVATLTPINSASGKMIGLGIESIGDVKQSFPQALATSIKQVIFLIKSILTTLGSLLRGLFTGHASTLGLMGPVGLAKEVGQASVFGLTYLLAFTATISVNLAVLNIMPFPALDGGRLIIVLGERITRRKFSKKTSALIHGIGFIILLGLMVLLTIADIRKSL